MSLRPPDDQPRTQDTIADRIAQRRADKDFQERLRRAVERNRKALALLAK